MPGIFYGVLCQALTCKGSLGKVGGNCRGKLGGYGGESLIPPPLFKDIKITWFNQNLVSHRPFQF